MDARSVSYNDKEVRSLSSPEAYRWCGYVHLLWRRGNLKSYLIRHFVFYSCDDR